MIIAGGITSALTTFAGLGAALMLDDAGAEKVRLGWTAAPDPRLAVTALGASDAEIAAVVHDHAAARTDPGSWLQTDLTSKPWNGQSAVFSPRVKAAESDEQWHSLQEARWDGIDALRTDPRRSLDTALIGSLGEPAYWRFNAQHRAQPDEGASRWEMKTRNRGEDFVRSRLRKLAPIVAARSVEEVRSGLTGETVVDEAYRGKRSSESRTATGLTKPRFTDSAVAWCGLWGIAAFPVSHRLSRPSATAGAVPPDRSRPRALVLPALVGRFSVERWLAVIASGALAVASAGEDPAAVDWLRAHGAIELIEYPFEVSDNVKTPERYLGDGHPVLGPAVLGDAR